MAEFNFGSALLLVILSIVITWAIGLLPPILTRYAILRRPLERWPAIGLSLLFFFINNIIFIGLLNSKNKSHHTITTMAFVSYWILRRGASAAPVNKPTEIDAGPVHSSDK